MSAAKANNNKDAYRATAITLIVFGVLYLIDKLIHFSSLGLSWVMNKDNFLLYTAVIFLCFKRDKSVGAGVDRAVAGTELRTDNRVARHDVRLSFARSLTGDRQCLIFDFNEIG